MSMAASAGIEIPKSDQGCALTLGTTDVTPMEMARAYATFAARGRRPEPLMVLKVVGPDGNIIHERQPRSEQTIDENVADTVSWILEQNIQRGTGTRARLPWPAMGKTGTAQNHADASFAGSTPELTAVVWMGYPPTGSPPQIPLMTSVHGDRVTGGSLPAIVWRKFMFEALQRSKHSDFPTPDRLDGEVLEPSPVPCPAPGSTPSPGTSPRAGAARIADLSGCVPQPSPSGFFEFASPSAPPVVESPQPEASPSPSPPACLLGILCPARS
jgi:penicillin-binding protein 1A